MESNWKWKPRRAFICGSMNIFMRNSRSKRAAKERQSSRDRADSKGPHTLTLNNVAWKIEQSMLWSSQAKTWHDDGRRKECVGTVCEWPPCFLASSGHSAFSGYSITQLLLPGLSHTSGNPKAWETTSYDFTEFYWANLWKFIFENKQTNKQYSLERKTIYFAQIIPDTQFQRAATIVNFGITKDSKRSKI